METERLGPEKASDGVSVLHLSSHSESGLSIDNELAAAVSAEPLPGCSNPYRVRLEGKRGVRIPNSSMKATIRGRG